MCVCVFACIWRTMQTSMNQNKARVGGQTRAGGRTASQERDPGNKMRYSVDDGDLYSLRNRRCTASIMVQGTRRDVLIRMRPLSYRRLPVAAHGP